MIFSKQLARGHNPTNGIWNEDNKYIIYIGLVMSAFSYTPAIIFLNFHFQFNLKVENYKTDNKTVTKTSKHY